MRRKYEVGKENKCTFKRLKASGHYWNRRCVERRFYCAGFEITSVICETAYRDEHMPEDHYI
jgi:hypothetical protein